MRFESRFASEGPVRRSRRRPVGRAAALSLFAAIACAAHAQSPEELKSAADKWLGKPAFKIAYDTPQWRSTFEVDRAAGMTWFVGGRGYCFNQKVPTKVGFDGQRLVVAFEFRQGCDAIEYRFNPATGTGEIFSGPPGTELINRSGAVSLRE